MAQADVNAVAAGGHGRTALQSAAEGGHLDMVERLLAAEAEVNAVAGRFSGQTALQAAAQGGHLDVVEKLKRAGSCTVLKNQLPKVILSFSIFIHY